MEAAYTSDTSVDIDLRTRQYIPEDPELHTRRRENLKSHVSKVICKGYPLRELSLMIHPFAIFTVVAGMVYKVLSQYRSLNANCGRSQCFLFHILQN
jgi:hypothetical protein